ncbi:DC1, C1-like, zinc finger, RING/FYVE/PHD-type containing protein [Tanacetum coccineum]
MSLHNPMKRVKLLCDGCVRPSIQCFLRCSKECSNFVFHEWCARLRPELKVYLFHEHTLVLRQSCSLFCCEVCGLPCNGFAYSCDSCEYCIDFHYMTYYSYGNEDVVDLLCAWYLPKTIRHKYDKHPLKLSSSPVENHKGQYVCEVCEEDLNPEKWFYHCSDCDQSIHSACSTLILKSEQGANSSDDELVYKFINMKFGGVHDIEDHEHSLSFVAGTTSDGNCTKCGLKLHFKFILKCLQCKFAIHSYCQSSVTESAAQNQKNL